MNKSKVFMIIGIVLIIAAGVQFYLSYDAHNAVSMINNSYEIEAAYGDYEGMISSNAREAEEETKSHILLTSGVVSTIAAVGFFVADKRIKRQE